MLFQMLECICTYAIYTIYLPCLAVHLLYVCNAYATLYVAHISLFISSGMLLLQAVLKNKLCNVFFFNFVKVLIWCLFIFCSLLITIIYVSYCLLCVVCFWLYYLFILYLPFMVTLKKTSLLHIYLFLGSSCLSIVCYIFYFLHPCVICWCVIYSWLYMSTMLHVVLFLAL